MSRIRAFCCFMKPASEGCRRPFHAGKMPASSITVSHPSFAPNHVALPSSCPTGAGLSRIPAKAERAFNPVVIQEKTGSRSAVAHDKNCTCDPDRKQSVRKGDGALMVDNKWRSGFKLNLMQPLVQYKKGNK